MCWLELWTVSQEDRDSNPLAAISELQQFGGGGCCGGDNGGGGGSGCGGGSGGDPGAGAGVYRHPIY